MSVFFPQNTESESVALVRDEEEELDYDFGDISTFSFEDLAADMFDPNDVSLTEYLLNFRGNTNSESADIDENSSYLDAEGEGSFEFDLNVFDDNHTEYERIFERPTKKKKTQATTKKQEKPDRPKATSTSKRSISISTKTKPGSRRNVENSKKKTSSKVSPKTKETKLKLKTTNKKKADEKKFTETSSVKKLLFGPSCETSDKVELCQTESSVLSKMKDSVSNSNHELLSKESSVEVSLPSSPLPGQYSPIDVNGPPCCPISPPKNVSNVSNENNIEKNGMTKNALLAKMNREKKKQYVQQLENGIENYKCQNAALQRICGDMKDQVQELRMEISYLKGVLANQSQLAGLLKNIGSTEGVDFVGNVDEGNGKLKRKQDSCLESDGPNKKSKTGIEAKLVKAAGVCLHVKSGKVSLEFCAKCNKSSSCDEMH